MLNAVKRMRCSRRSGVIFLAMITAIAWPTPHHRLRRSLSSRRSLLVDSFASCCTPPRLIPAPNHAPVARRCNRRGLAKPDHRGKMKNRPGGVYSRPSDSSFSLPRGRVWRVGRVARATPSFIQSTFSSHTGSLLLSSLKKVTSPSSPLVPSFLTSPRGRTPP